MTDDKPADPGLRPAEERKPDLNSGLLNLVQLLVVTTPGYVRMRFHPEMDSWGANLVGFSERSELLPLAEPLKKIVKLFADGFDTFDPIIEALSAGASEYGPQTLINASRTSAEIRKEYPHTSFMLAWVALCTWVLWARVAGHDLYSEGGPYHLPNIGWRDIPAECIAAALQLQGIYGASLLAAEAHALLQTNRRRHPENLGELEPTIAKYRRLAITLESRNDMAIAGLADDLREACRAGGRARRLVAALLWTMGLVPECNAMSQSPEASWRALLLRLVRSSFQVLPTDPLVQYLWLEMKNAPELDLRAHEALYVVLNHKWDQWWLDKEYEMLGLRAEPSRLYGLTLEALLAGDLDETRASEFLQAYDLVVDLNLPIPPSAFLRPRLAILRHIIGERFGYFPSEFTEREQVEWLREKTIIEARARRAASMFPERTDAITRTGIAMHETIERILGEESKFPAPERERCTLALESLETFRTGGLSYWLDVIPPLPPEKIDERLGQLLVEERELLDHMRGAYFLALRPTLPLHFTWSDMDSADFFALREPSHRTSFYSADVARKEMSELDILLASLANRLSAEDPEYAMVRQRPCADLRRLVSMLVRHRRPVTS